MTHIAPCPSCKRTFASDNDLGQHVRATHNSPGWVKAQTAKKTHRFVPVCPKCSGTPTFSTGKFGTKAECCGLWSWNLKALVSRETHAARIRAHDAFDRLWKGGILARGECYRRLQVAMRMTKDECHIAQMSEQQAKRVVEIVRSGVLVREAVDA